MILLVMLIISILSPTIRSNSSNALMMLKHALISAILIRFHLSGYGFWRTNCLKSSMLLTSHCRKEKGWIKRYFFYRSLVVVDSLLVVAGECHEAGEAFPVWCVVVQRGNAQGVQRGLLGNLGGFRWQKVVEGAGCWQIWSSGPQRLLWFLAATIASVVEIAWRGWWWIPEEIRILSVKRIE